MSLLDSIIKYYSVISVLTEFNRTWQSCVLGSSHRKTNTSHLPIFSGFISIPRWVLIWKKMAEEYTECLLENNKYHEHCPGCKVDQMKKSRRGFPFSELLSVWIIVLCTGTLFLHTILCSVEEHVVSFPTFV